MTPEEIAAVDLALIAPDSLQQETAEGLTLESTLCAEEPSVSLVERIALRDAIDALPEKERKTILLRFFKGLTQEQTARILQVSQVQGSRLGAAACKSCGTCWQRSDFGQRRRKKGGVSTAARFRM